MDMDRLKQEYDDSINTNEFHDLVRRYIVFEQDKQSLNRQQREIYDNINKISSWQGELREKIRPFKKKNMTVRTVVFDKTIGVVTWQDDGRGCLTIQKTTVEREPKE